MIKKQIFYSQLFRQFRGVLRCGMAFLIGTENISLSGKAERFVKQPVAVPGVNLLAVVIRLVPAAGKLPAVPYVHGKTILLRLYRPNIKKDRLSYNPFRDISVMERHHMRPVSDKGVVFL